MTEIQQKAELFAREVHEGQFRKGEAREPYAVHLEEVVELVKKLLLRKYNFLESFAEDFFKNIFKNKYVESAVLKIEKLEVIKEAESVGIEFFKQREEYEKS